MTVSCTKPRMRSPLEIVRVQVPGALVRRFLRSGNSNHRFLRDGCRPQAHLVAAGLKARADFDLPLSRSGVRRNTHRQAEYYTAAVLIGLETEVLVLDLLGFWLRDSACIQLELRVRSHRNLHRNRTIRGLVDRVQVPALFDLSGKLDRDGLARLGCRRRR